MLKHIHSEKGLCSSTVCMNMPASGSVLLLPLQCAVSHARRSGGLLCNCRTNSYHNCRVLCVSSLVTSTSLLIGACWATSG